jgi:hypothetical protein
VPNVKKSGDGPINVIPFKFKKRKEKKKCGCTHELINMNPTHPQEQKGGPFTP